MEVRQEVKDFAKAMEYKLICHDSKTQMATLGKEDIQWFIDGLLDEELLSANAEWWEKRCLGEK